MTALPSSMPAHKTDPLRRMILGALLETKPVSWTFRSLTKDESGKEDVVETKVTRQGLNYPLAQNISDFNVDRAARRWF